MGRELERRLDLSGAIWEKLEGKRIIFAGIENRQRQNFRQNLTHIDSQSGGGFTVADGIGHAEKGDYVFLFSGMTGKDGAKELQELLAQLRTLAGKKPEAAVLVSDNRVYGKYFGVPHNLKEDELGYVCHTAAAETELQYMRMAEHLAYRLAKEEGLNLRIVRADDRQSGEALRIMLEAAVGIMLWGGPGEVYNLPVQSETVDDRLCSPLSPVPVATDAGKTELLING